MVDKIFPETDIANEDQYIQVNFTDAKHQTCSTVCDRPIPEEVEGQRIQNSKLPQSRRTGILPVTPNPQSQIPYL
ncbi:MAG: hypothetical protein WBV73_02530 [Phormidium sp.]